MLKGAGANDCALTKINADLEENGLIGQDQMLLTTRRD